MSEPSFRLIHSQANRSFIFKWEPFDLTTRWHYHPEIELIYFIEGKTTGVIGEGFQQFEEDDLVMLGANFPHVLQEDVAYITEYPASRPFGLIIQFTEDFLGTEFFNKPEMQQVRKMLTKAHRGLIFRKNVVKKVKDTLLAMHRLPENRKLLMLLEVLVTLSESQGYDFLTPKDYSYDHTQDEYRMHSINQFVYENFKEDISISTIASIANMTDTSFCRYFKSRTLKTFTRFLNEVRIAYACKQLNNSNASVTNVCFESGFNNLSYFTRQFKNIMKMPPGIYKQWQKDR